MGSGSDKVPARLVAGEHVLSVEGLSMSTVSDSPQHEVELRCPTGPRKLFAKLRLEGAQPVITSDNLIELACQDCRRTLRKEGQDVALVLHRYDIIGNLIETVSVDRED
jgi:hypothetical protein